MLRKQAKKAQHRLLIAFTSRERKRAHPLARLAAGLSLLFDFKRRRLDEIAMQSLYL